MGAFRIGRIFSIAACLPNSLLGHITNGRTLRRCHRRLGREGDIFSFYGILMYSIEDGVVLRVFGLFMSGYDISEHEVFIVRQEDCLFFYAGREGNS